MSSSRPSYGSSDRGTYGNGRTSRFSAKRSRSRSPVQSSYGGSSSRFDSRDSNGAQSSYGNGGDYKRPRTEHSGSNGTYGSSQSASSTATADASRKHQFNLPPPPAAATAAYPFSAFPNQAYPSEAMQAIYSQAYQMYAQSQPPLPPGPPPS